MPAVRLPRWRPAVSSGPHHRHRGVRGSGAALEDLRDGHVNGVLTIPPDFSRRVLAKNAPRPRAHRGNTDAFVSVTLSSTLNSVLASYAPGVVAPRVARARPRRGRGLPLRSLHPVPPAGLGGDVDLRDGHDQGGIIFIDDKARGLHEGYLVTPSRSSN